MLMMALDLEMWAPILNVDGTLTVKRESPLHNALVANYKYHLYCVGGAGWAKANFSFTNETLMDADWGIEKFNGEPQAILSGSTGLRVLTDQVLTGTLDHSSGNIDGGSDYDVFVTYQAAELVRTKLLRH